MDKFLIQTISGDLNQCSIFNLGIFPYMISNLIVQVIYAFKSDEAKKKVSAKKRNGLTLMMTLIISMIQSITHIGSLEFGFQGIDQILGYIVVFWEMVAGSMVIVLLCSNNKKYGIGGQSIIILSNILTSILTNISNYSGEDLVVPVIISLFVLVVILVMENAEVRIPLQRISIHNIYADKNYLAIKLNPAGVMPAMFSSAFFLLPQILVTSMVVFFPSNRMLLWLKEQLYLTQLGGIIIYIFILYILTISFSFVFINPKDITDQFLKNGDSFLDIHLGKDTIRYLRRVIWCVSIFSATIMGLCLGIPLYLQYIGKMAGGLNILPSSVMMLTGIMCSLFREAEAIKNLEAYKPFI